MTDLTGLSRWKQQQPTGKFEFIFYAEFHDLDNILSNQSEVIDMFDNQVQECGITRYYKSFKDTTFA